MIVQVSRFMIISRSVVFDFWGTLTYRGIPHRLLQAIREIRGRTLKHSVFTGFQSHHHGKTGLLLTSRLAELSRVPVGLLSCNRRSRSHFSGINTAK